MQPNGQIAPLFLCCNVCVVLPLAGVVYLVTWHCQAFFFWCMMVFLSHCEKMSLIYCKKNCSLLSLTPSLSLLSLYQQCTSTANISHYKALNSQTMVQFLYQPPCEKWVISYHDRNTPLISTYVFSGLATEQVLIFGAVLTFGGGGGYEEAEAKIMQGTSLFDSSALRTQHAVVHVSAIMRILPGYRGSYIRGVCTFGALQPTANFSKNWRGTYFRRGTYLR